MARTGYKYGQIVQRIRVNADGSETVVEEFQNLPGSPYYIPPYFDPSCLDQTTSPQTTLAPTTNGGTTNPVTTSAGTTQPGETTSTAPVTTSGDGTTTAPNTTSPGTTLGNGTTTESTGTTQAGTTGNPTTSSGLSTTQPPTTQAGTTIPPTTAAVSQLRALVQIIDCVGYGGYEVGGYRGNVQFRVLREVLNAQNSVISSQLSSTVFITADNANDTVLVNFPPVTDGQRIRVTLAQVAGSSSSYQITAQAQLTVSGCATTSPITTNGSTTTQPGTTVGGTTASPTTVSGTTSGGGTTTQGGGTTTLGGTTTPPTTLGNGTTLAPTTLNGTTTQGPTTTPGTTTPGSTAPPTTNSPTTVPGTTSAGTTLGATTAGPTTTQPGATTLVPTTTEAPYPFCQAGSIGIRSSVPSAYHVICDMRDCSAHNWYAELGEEPFVPSAATHVSFAGLFAAGGNGMIDLRVAARLDSDQFTIKVYREGFGEVTPYLEESLGLGVAVYFMADPAGCYYYDFAPIPPPTTEPATTLAPTTTTPPPYWVPLDPECVESVFEGISHWAIGDDFIVGGGNGQPTTTLPQTTAPPTTAGPEGVGNWSIGTDFEVQ